MNTEPKKPNAFRNIIAFIGGLIFLAGSVFTAFSIVVSIVMLFQGKPVSPLILLLIAGILLMGWIIILLSGVKFREAMKMILSSGI